MLRCYELIKITPNDGVGFLVAYLERFLVENVKRILRAKQSRELFDKNLLIPIPKQFEFVDLQAMSEASTLQDSVDLLKKTRFAKIEDVMSLYQKYGLVSLIEGALDKIYFDSEVRMNLRKVPDRDMVENMLSIEVDFNILKTLIDLRARGIPADAACSVLASPAKLGRSELQLISEANAESVSEALSRTSYAQLAQPVRDALNMEKEETLDSVFRSEICGRTNSIMVACSETFGYVLGYIRAAETEANNLVSLVTAKEIGLPESKTESTLCI